MKIIWIEEAGEIPLDAWNHLKTKYNMENKFNQITSEQIQQIFGYPIELFNMKYQDMNIIEQKEFETKLLHAVRNFPTGFCMANEIIELATKYKIFDNVKIGRDHDTKRKNNGDDKALFHS